jgi:hypothetical protein
MSPVAGEPLSSYNNVAGAGQAEMAIWNGTITDISYVGPIPDLSSSANQSQQVEISFTSGSDPSETVILAWGGHIAGRDEWGFLPNGDPRSAGGISGSPYHMRLIDWNFGNLGNKDLSMSIDLVSEADIPDTPANFTATPFSTSQIDLSWDAVSSSIALNYVLQQSLSPDGPWTEIATLPQSTTSFSDMDLEEFTRYFYRIFATNSDGASDFATATTKTFSTLSSSTNLNGKSGDKIGFELTSLSIGAAGDNPSPTIYQFDEDGDVLIEVVAFKNPSTVAAVVDLLQTKYGRVDSKFILDPSTYVAEDRNLIDVYFDVTRLEELNFEEIINFVRPVFRPLFGSIGETGVIYQGDSSQSSFESKKSFKISRINPGTGLPEPVFIDATGESIGAISNSFNTQPFSGADSRYVTDQKNRDLPGPNNPVFTTPVQNLEDAPAESSDEGRAMLQIVHDIAPGAELGFHTGLPTLNKFAEAIDDLSMAGFKYIVDDITFLVENFFGQYGPVYNAMTDHTGRDPENMLFSSAGNFADKAIEGVLNFVPIPAGSDIYPEGVTGYIHDFGGGDLTLDIFANPGEYILVFQWDEAFSSLGDPIGTLNDLDLFVVNDLLEVEAGNNRINIDGDALELLVLRSAGAKASNLVFTCECETPPAGLNFRMIAFKTSGDVSGAGLEFTEPISAPTVSGHAGFDIPKLVTVGASFYGFYGSGAGPDLEPFSSLGAPFASAGGQNKVTITAADGGNTNVLSIGEDILFDPDLFPNFFGTSAAAPGATAAWALAASAIKQWYPSGVPAGLYSDPSFATGNPPDEVTGLFLESASPVSNQDIGGAGLLRVEDALIGVAAQTPFLSGFTIEDGVISIDTAQVTLLGDYFTSSSQVIFNGDSVETTYVSETELSVTIMPFSGDAAFVVANAAPITESGIDGGESNTLDLLDGRRALTIVADDISKSFGQDFDDLTFSVEGLLEGETYESLGLPEVVLTSTAVGPYPDVNNYRIDASFATPLSPEQEDLYIVAFRPGVLSVTPLALTIQVADTTSIYGDNPVVLINYIYDTNGISDNAAFLDFLKTEHESTYLTYTDSTTGLQNRFSAVVNRFSAVVNENPDRAGELIDLLINSNWLATETTIENRFSPVVNRFSAVVNYVPFDADQLLDFLDEPLIGNSGALENRFSAVVNGEDLVTGQTAVFNPLENRFSPVVNRFSAVVNRFSAVVNVPLGDEDDETDLTQTLALVDAEDGNNTEFDTVSVYSIDVITGLGVTLTNDERHYMVSGAALAPVFTNCIVNYVPGRLTVTPNPITLTLDEITPITYGETVEFSTTVTGNTAYGDTLKIDYFLNPVPASTTPISAGNYTVEQVASTTDSTGTDNSFNYDFTIVNGPLVVNKGTLDIFTEDVVINEGDDIPPASDIVSTIEGYIPGEGPEDVFGPGGPTFSYSSPDYEMMGRIAGSYALLTAVIPADPADYIMNDTGALLNVNPADCQKINIFLECVSTIKGNNQPYAFEVFFRYENRNAVSIFVPRGPLNELTCTDCDDSQLPIEFLPGEHTFSILFDGSEVRWELTTCGIQNPTSVSVDGNDVTGNKCSGKKIPNGRIANPDGTTDSQQFNSEELHFYPNPVNNHLVVQVNESFTHRDYELYNSLGIRYPVKAVINPGYYTAEFDFSALESGLYLLKLNIDGTNATIRILRE